MVTENVNIVFVETGTRVIKRRIDEIGVAADKATRGLFLLQRALFVLGGAGFASGLQRTLDSLTQYENRIRLTAESSREVEEVQDRLFLAANRSRSAFSSLAEIYSRTALSVKELGVSQDETLRFTESLAKASIISGASAREANAALIQLGQGLASDRLSGDELRSILEQLPFVAQVIADSLGVTRGELRKLGADGEISAAKVLKAFREAATEIDALFANTVPTIAQSFEIAQNNLLQFIDTFDDTSGASALVANSIIALSESLDSLAAAAGVAIIGALGGALDLVSKRASVAVRSQLEFTRAVSSGNLVLLGSIQAEQQKAAFTLANARSQQASAASIVANTQAQVANTQAKLAAARAEVLATEFSRVGNNARLLATGRFANLTASVTNYDRAVRRLALTEGLLQAQQGRLTAQQAALIASTNALTAATAASSSVAARAGTLVGRFALAFPVLTAGIVRATGAFKSLLALLAANPFTVLFIAASAAAVALGKLRDASEAVSAVSDRNAEIFRGVAAAFNEAKASGDSLRDTYKALSDAQLALAQTEAINAQREAIRALVDQIAGFNSIATDLRTALTVNTEFASGAIEVRRYFDALVAGEIDIIQFRDEIARLGSEVGQSSPRFLEFARGIVDSTSSAVSATQKMRELDAVIKFLNGSANAAEAALAGMALGLNNVAGSASAAASAVEFFISKIPALKEAQRVQSGLAEASSKFGAAQNELNESFAAGNIDSTTYAGKLAELSTLYNTAVKEIDGTAEAQRRLSAETKRYAEQAELASLSGLDRTLRRNQIEYQGLIEKAREAGASQKELNAIQEQFNSIQAAARRDAAGGGGGGGGSSDPKFLDKINAIEIEIDALKRYSNQVQFANELIALEGELKRQLTQDEVELATSRLNTLEIAKQQLEILREIQSPQDRFQVTQAALNNLFEQGAITLEQYNAKLRETSIAAMKAENSLGGGFRAAIAGALESAGQFGEALGGVLVGAAGRAADAIVEFAKTGRFSIRQFFGDLFAQLLKLSAQRLLLQFLGGAFGIAGGGFAGVQNGGMIPAFAPGGSITPNGAGSTDTQIVSFKKRPDERVDILTPGQQAAQQRNLNNGMQQAQPVAQPIVNVAVLISEDDIERVMSGSTGDRIIVRGIERNSSTIGKVTNNG